METIQRKGRWKNHPPHAQLICQECGTAFTVRPCRAQTARYCSYPCHQKGEGKKGGAVTAQIQKSRSQGISYIKKNGRHLHRQIMEQKIGRPLRPGEIVHHKDENHLNNHPDNLQLFASQAEHAAHHAQLRSNASRSTASRPNGT